MARRTNLPDFHIGPRAERRLTEMRGGNHALRVRLTWLPKKHHANELVELTVEDVSGSDWYGRFGESELVGSGDTVELAVADAYRQYKKHKQR